jgi:hypothetical protein
METGFFIFAGTVKPPAFQLTGYRKNRPDNLATYGLSARYECIERSKGRKQVGLRTGATTQIPDHPGIDNPRDYIFGGNLWYLLLVLEGVFGQMNP